MYNRIIMIQVEKQSSLYYREGFKDGDTKTLKGKVVGCLSLAFSSSCIF